MLSKHRMAAGCLVENIHVFSRLPLSTSYSAVGCEFNVNESTMYIKEGAYN